MRVGSGWRRGALAVVAAAMAGSVGAIGVGAIGVGAVGVAVTDAAMAAEPAATSDLEKVLAADAKIRRAFTGAAEPLAGSGRDGPSGGGLAASGAPPTRGDRINVGFAFTFDRIAVGAAHTCAITILDALWCFGDNASGQLGNGTTTRARGPVRTSARGALAKKVAVAVTAGRAHTCTLAGEGAAPIVKDVYCWGADNVGQLGDGGRTTRTGPVRVLRNAVAVAAGQEHTCAALDDGTVSCWGRNNVGQLGLGTIGGVHNAPRRVPGLRNVIGISADDNDTCALVESAGVLGGLGTAWCWGSNTHGQLGNGHVSGTPSSSPVAVVMTGVNVGFVQIDVGRRHVCAVDEAGGAYCWGSDAAGQLGNGSASGNVSTPFKIVAKDRYFWGVTAGDASSCAVDGSGRAYCWGDNADGRLGVGDRGDRAAPAAVDQAAVLPSPIIELLLGAHAPMLAGVVAGGGHACAVGVDGNVYCWGDNAAGQLGVGGTGVGGTGVGGTGVGGTGGVEAPVPTVLTPGPPTGVRVRPGERSLAVSWRAPADTGAAPIKEYAALAVRGTGFDVLDDQQVCTTRERPHCVIGKVTNGRRYAVFVGVATLGGVAYSVASKGTPASSGAGGGLPVTGTAVLRYLTTGGTLVAVGVLMLLSVRRRGRGPQIPS